MSFANPQARRAVDPCPGGVDGGLGCADAEEPAERDCRPVRLRSRSRLSNFGDRSPAPGPRSRRLAPRLRSEKLPEVGVIFLFGGHAG